MSPAVIKKKSEMRLAWPDVARGIGIIVVVFGHVIEGLINANIADAETWQWGRYISFTNTMPLFFFLAGLNVGGSLNKKTPHAFLKGKCQNILYPYVLWSWIQGSIQIAFAGDVNHPVQWSDLFSIAWQPFQQFWFLYSLLLFQLAALALKGRPKAMFALSVVLAIAQHSLALSDYQYKLFHYFVFFAAANLLTTRIVDFQKNQTRFFWPLIALYGLFVWAGGMFTAFDQQSALTFLTAATSIAAMILLCDRIKGLWLKPLLLVGRASMTIFILHVTFSAGARVLIHKSGLPVSTSTYVIACIFCGVCLPIFVFKVAKQMRLNRWLGLGA